MRAAALVGRARAAVTRRGLLRAGGAGVTAGALSGAAAAAGGWIAGFAPGPWLLAALVPAAAVFLLRLRRVRPSLVSAALLLDRAAGARERFTAAIVARDPEVRVLAASQALSREPFRSGGWPLRFPPSMEGFAAVLALALFGGVLLLARGGPAPAGTEWAGARPAGAAPGGGAPVTGPPGRATAPVEPRVARGADLAAKLASGGELTGEEWDALRGLGLPPADRDAVRAAAARGDGEGAAAALREALRRVVARRAAGGAEAGGEGERTKPPSTAEILEWPTWSPRFDRVVRAYFGP